MQIIDRNSDKFGDGEYLQICNHLKSAYASRTDPVYLFDYEETRRIENSLMFESFYDKAIDADYNYLQGQINYLRRERTDHKKLIRITKRVKLDAQYDFCEMMGLSDADWEELSVGAKNQVFNRYLLHENEFRERYREKISHQIGRIQDAIDGLDGV